MPQALRFMDSFDICTLVAVASLSFVVGCMEISGPTGPLNETAGQLNSQTEELDSNQDSPDEPPAPMPIALDVEITAPVASAELPFATQSAQTVSGTCTVAGGSVSISVNSTSVGSTPCLSDGTFSTTVDFSSETTGSATLLVSQVAQAGTSYMTTDSHSITVTNGAPIAVDLEMSAPVASTLLLYSTRSNRTVSGTCTANEGSINIDANGVSLGTTSCLSDGTFSTTVDFSSVTGTSVLLTSTQVAQAGTSYETTDSDTVTLSSWVEICSNTGQTTDGTKPFATAGTDGSVGNPHLICTLGQLQNVGANSGLFELRDGNDGSGTPQTIAPIGNLTGTSIFDGKTLEIRNLRFASASGHVGLFAELTTSAIVRNLKLKNLKVTSSTRSSGLLAGYLTGSAKVMNVSLENTTTLPYTDLVRTTSTSTDAAGSLVGYLNACTLSAEAGIHDSSAVGSVVAIQNALAGFALGGLVGRAAGNCVIRNSTANVRVEGLDRVGGLVGESQSSLVSGSRAMGEVSGRTSVGGFVGRNKGVSWILCNWLKSYSLRL